MRDVSHPRIVEFKGFIVEIFAIVMEYLPEGTLYDYIKQHPSMPWSERYWCAADVAEGMAFLHSKTMANGRKKDELFHQDLKTANILLLREKGGELRAKISDFGLSVIKKHQVQDDSRGKHNGSSAYTQMESTPNDTNVSFVQHVGGTRKYLAPELERSAKFTKAW